jgi:RNA polymerase sigma-70 factor (ECF subfamily)
LDHRKGQTANELYRSWWPVAVDYAARKLGNLEEAEVVAQEALIRALDVLAREPVTSFPALVLRIAHNLVVDRVRRQDWRAEREEPDELPGPATTDSIELARLRLAVDELPAELREIVELRYVDDRSFAEIAAELQMSKNGVFARHERAIDALRSAFGRARIPWPASWFGRRS